MENKGKGGRPMGGSKSEQSRLKSSSPIQIDTSVKPERIKNDQPNTKYRCTCCGKEYNTQKGNFPVSKSFLYEGNNGYIHICKHCVEKLYQQLVGFYSGNEEHALEHCCRLFDWYYNSDIVAMTKNISQGRSKVLVYPSKMNVNQAKGTTYLDTLKDRHSNKIMTMSDITPDEMADGEETSGASRVSKEAIMFFGFGYTDEEYDFLLNQYTDWTTRYDCKTKAQEELFKSLCIAQLTIQKAQLRGSTKEVTDAMKAFQDLLGTSNLKPSQTNDNALADQNTFGTLIKKWETERPIGEPDEEWKDVDEIERYISTFFLGHLCNLVHVKNDYEELYREEMAKYTVTPPEYEEDDLGETSLLDKFSDKVTKDGDDSS